MHACHKLGEKASQSVFKIECTTDRNASNIQEIDIRAAPVIVVNCPKAAAGDILFYLEVYPTKTVKVLLSAMLTLV